MVLALLLALAASGMLIFCEEQTGWVRWMDINIYEHSWGKESIPKLLSCAGKCQLWKQGGKEMERFALSCDSLLMPFASKAHPIPWTIQTDHLPSPAPQKVGVLEHAASHP